MTNGLRVLILLTDSFGGFGGIAKFNRDFLAALDACVLVERVCALPRVITEAIKEDIPESIVYDRRAACGKAAFVQRLLAHARYDERVNLVVCGHLNLLPAAWLYARVRGARLAVIIHGVEAWVPRNGLANQLTRTVDAYIAVSRHTAEKFSSWSQVPMERVFILPNCVDLNRFQPQERDVRLVDLYGLCSGKVILTVGRLASDERFKGFDQVIEAMPQLLERFRTLKYLIIGDGDDRPRLEAKARTLGISKQVVFTGRIPESEKAAHYNLADAYVMPSSGEGFGIVLIEAAACGIPVIGSRTDGSREALLDGRLGRLIDPARPNELIEAVTAVLADECRPGRIASIETFSVKNFRARVAAWLRAQAIAYDSVQYAQDDILQASDLTDRVAERRKVN
jgi:phosphatidyl-myo-inositol dimannoside synthase